MPITKQALPVNFAKALDTKTDPKQVQTGKFLVLENTVFTNGGLLQKRNGFGSLPALPNASSLYLTTFNNNLMALGTAINIFNDSLNEWTSTAPILQQLNLQTVSMVRSGSNQEQCDSAVNSNGLICTVYTETNGSSTFYKYVVANSGSGQYVTTPALITPSSGAVTGSPRVFLLGVYFVIVFTVTISSSKYLQYISVSANNPSIVTAATDLYTDSVIPNDVLSWDGVVNTSSNSLFIAYNTTAGGQAIKITYLTESTAALGETGATPLVFAGQIATVISMAIDYQVPTNPIIYVSYFDSASSTGYTLAIYQSFLVVFNPVQTIFSGTIVNMTSIANNGVCRVYPEAFKAYSFDSSIPNNLICYAYITSAGTVTTVPISTTSINNGQAVFIRSLGLASKAFTVGGVNYFWGTYQSTYQPTYFLVNATTNSPLSPQIVAKLAYENGGGPYAAGKAYCPYGLPSVTVNVEKAQFSYLYKDLIEALTTNNNSIQNTTGGIYSQTGINLATLNFNQANFDSVNIARDLHISGGFLWMFDGTNNPVEHNFFLWPDMDIVNPTDAAVWSDTGGHMVANPSGWVSGQPSYYYQIVYAYTDNQGNVFRSAPSIPIPVTITTDASTTGSVTLHIPTLRVTMKTANPVVIEVYRWSVDLQSYHMVSSSSTQSNPVLAPLFNSVTVDAVTFVDTYASASIQGNALIYTTGGVIEDINAPATQIMTLFDTRVWLVDSEDQNLLWFSKQVIEAVPVEMSDLLTYYVSPTSGAQGTTGPITALSPLDDKLIIFKKDAIYYINGTGPDNTGANNQYSQPIFITATVGCSNQQSIVFMPDGLMFQSLNGIWLLGRDLSTTYIGAPVQAFNSSNVLSAINVPGTTQVRFTLDTGQTLMYDYYYGNWGTFVGVPGVSSCVYNGLHTLINSSGAVFQETPGIFLDGTNPVLMSFVTGYIQLSGISGFERIWEIQLLGEYVSPHLLNVQLGYDFGPLVQQAIIQPNNATGVYGSDSLYGQTSPFGGPGNLEQWRIQPSFQKCQAFQISLTEVYDPSFGVLPGAGFTLSAMTCVIGVNRSYRPVRATNTIGTQ